MLKLESSLIINIPNQPPVHCKFDCIQMMHPDSDSVVRTATIRTYCSYYYNTSISKKPMRFFKLGTSGIIYAIFSVLNCNINHNVHF